MTCKIPYRINEINVDNICYTDIKTNKNKTIVYLKYRDTNKLQNIVFQTPVFSSVNNIIQKNNIYEFDVPIKGKSDIKINKFINFVNSIDNKIMKDARTNHKWFASFSHQTEIKYQKIIRESDSPQYSNGMIRFKIIKSSDFNTTIQLNNKKIDINDIPRNSWVKSILEIYAIWINENGFGLFIRPILLDFKLNQTSLYNYKLIEDSDENEELDDAVCTIQDNSIFIKSENEITSSILEMPTTVYEVNPHSLSSESIEEEPDHNVIASATSE